MGHSVLETGRRQGNQCLEGFNVWILVLRDRHPSLGVVLWGSYGINNNKIMCIVVCFSGIIPWKISPKVALF